MRGASASGVGARCARPPFAETRRVYPANRPGARDAPLPELGIAKRQRTAQRWPRAHNERMTLGLYVHIPFCETKCPYCDFNTYAAIESLMPGYVDALDHEIGQWGAWLERPTLTSVFFGGGTPSYLPTRDIRRLMRSLCALGQRSANRAAAARLSGPRPHPNPLLQERGPKGTRASETTCVGPAPPV